MIQIGYFVYYQLKPQFKIERMPVAYEYKRCAQGLSEKVERDNPGSKSWVESSTSFKDTYKPLICNFSPYSQM